MKRQPPKVVLPSSYEQFMTEVAKESAVRRRIIPDTEYRALSSFQKLSIMGAVSREMHAEKERLERLRKMERDNG